MVMGVGNDTTSQVSERVESAEPTTQMDMEPDNYKPRTPFRPKSVFIPFKGRNAAVDTYCRMVDHDVHLALKKKKEYKTMNNMPKAEREALCALKADDTIVIRSADKGGSIVIQNTSDYVKECMRQLNDENSYKRLSKDPTMEFKSIIHNKLDTLLEQSVITKK